MLMQLVNDYDNKVFNGDGGVVTHVDLVRHIPFSSSPPMHPHTPHHN